MLMFEIAWDFIQNEKPNFDLVTLCPPMVYGPLRHTVKDVKELNQSNSRIYGFINSSKDAELPPNGMHVYTDVRVRLPYPFLFPPTYPRQDLALAHVKVATLPEASGQRFVICAGQISAQETADLLRKNIPELAERTPIGTPGGNPLPANAYDCSSEKAKKVLGLTFKSKEETFVELAKQLLEIEKAGL